MNPTMVDLVTYCRCTAFQLLYSKPYSKPLYCGTQIYARDRTSIWRRARTALSVRAVAALYSFQLPRRCNNGHVKYWHHGRSGHRFVFGRHVTLGILNYSQNRCLPTWVPSFEFLNSGLVCELFLGTTISLLLIFPISVYWFLNVAVSHGIALNP